MSLIISIIIVLCFKIFVFKILKQQLQNYEITMKQQQYKRLLEVLLDGHTSNW